MAGERTRAAVFAQPEWLRAVQAERPFPEGARPLFTGCGTSFHAAQAGGEAVQALDLVLRPEHDADLLVAVSHEGETPMTVEAVQAWEGRTWLVTGNPDGPLGRLCNDVTVCTPRIEESWCHTASYTCAVAALRALQGEDVSGLPDAVEDALRAHRLEVTEHEHWAVVGAGEAWPTAQEAVLKLREGAWVVAEAHHTEQLLHGYMSAMDETWRCFVLAPDGPAGERAETAARSLRELGAHVELVPCRHPVVDIVPFQLLTLDLADARGADPDLIRRDHEPWKRARAVYP